MNHIQSVAFARMLTATSRTTKAPSPVAKLWLERGRLVTSEAPDLNLEKSLFYERIHLTFRFPNTAA